MFYLKKKIMREFGLNCYDPPNGVAIHIDPLPSVPIDVSLSLLTETEQAAAGASAVW
mgnify:CR=1 FL=1